MNKSLLFKIVLFTCVNLTFLSKVGAQSNLLPGLISAGPAYTFIDEDLFEEIPKAEKALEKNSSTSTDESYAANIFLVKASKVFVDFNSNAPVEFSAIAPWATDYIWKFGDGSVISGIQNASHLFKTPGVYKVSVTASNANQIQNETIEIKVIDNGNYLKLEEMGHFVVFPVDNKLVADIQLDLPTRERKLYIEIQDIEGNQVIERMVGKVKKKQKVKLDMNDLAEGKYYAILKGKRFSMISKITIIRG